LLLVADGAQHASRTPRKMERMKFFMVDEGFGFKNEMGASHHRSW
jgi:hypothetical protein